MRHDHAVAAFKHRHQSIIAKLDALRAAAKDHFNVDRDTLHYGHVADVSRIDAILDEALQNCGAIVRETNLAS